MTEAQASDGMTERQITLEKDVQTEKAVFIPMGTEEDFKEFEKEQKGFKGIFGT